MLLNFVCTSKYLLYETLQLLSLKLAGKIHMLPALGLCEKHCVHFVKGRYHAHAYSFWNILSA